MPVTLQRMLRNCQKNARVVAFIDPAIDDFKAIATGFLPEVNVLILDPREDGIKQIVNTLAELKDVTTVHLFCHGAPGELYLCRTQLSLETLGRYANLPNWAAAFTNRNLLLYSDNVAEGLEGKKFLQHLHHLTGASIAASAHSIGCADSGGRWELEVQLGQVTATQPLKPEALATYNGFWG